MGVDACKRGWIGVVLDGGPVRAVFGRTIAELVGRACEASSVAVIAIDMPIGLPDVGVRQSDVLARRLVGARSASVFLTPVRAALALEDYTSAARVNQERTGGRGISAQAFSLRAKIHEVEAWRPSTGLRVAEAHPEVSFAAMAGQPLLYPKKTWAGAELRRRLLTQSGVTVPAQLGEAGGEAAVDDVLDAAAAAWTASRILSGTAYCVPDPPEIFGDGVPSAIWS